MPSPWFKFPRRYMESSFCRRGDYNTLYLWMASQVAGTEHSIVVGNQEMTLRPGQFITTSEKAARQVGLGRMQVRSRWNALKDNQLIDLKPTNSGTLVTLIDPDTYAWQRTVYGRILTSKNVEFQPTNNQRITTTIEDKIINSTMRVCAYGEEEGGELSEEDSKRFEASFSSTKTFVLEVWKRERERYGLPSKKSPRNFRMADSVAAMIDDGEWTRDDWEKAVRNFMADPWAREHGGINAVYEEFERWLSAGGKANGNINPTTSAAATRVGGKERSTGKFAHIDADNFGTGTGG